VTACSNGVPSTTQRPLGDSCGAGLVCNGAGACVAGCNAPSDCPGADTACSTRTCGAAHTCGVALAAFGTDCGGGLVCNGAGLCGCSVAADCPGADTACATRQCQAQACSTSFAAAGTALADPTPGDCHALQCDGAGNVVSLVDDADLPVDGNVCTQDLCTGGVPSHPPASSATACPGGTCDGAGNCPTAAQNGCTRATAADLTAQASVTVTFPVGLLFQYSQPCIAVRAGTAVTFSGPLLAHPFTGGEVVGLALVPASSGPFAGSRATGNAATFTVPAGTWPYYCALHGGVGMMGVVYAVP
jgi:plastocyanin